MLAIEQLKPWPTSGRERPRIRAQREELLRQAGLEPRGRLYGMACRVLCSTGRGLVALGRRLEQFDLKEPLPLEGSVSAGR